MRSTERVYCVSALYKTRGMKFLSSLSESVKLCDLSLSPGRRSISRGNTGRRTWFGEDDTAAYKRLTTQIHCTYFIVFNNSQTSLSSLAILGHGYCIR